MLISLSSTGCILELLLEAAIADAGPLSVGATRTSAPRLVLQVVAACVLLVLAVHGVAGEAVTRRRCRPDST
jgi:hypothetical protein